VAVEIVEAHVLPGWIPGLVGIVAVHHQEERLPAVRSIEHGFLEQPRGLAEHLGAEPVLYALAALRVGQVLADL
jgi:hypothetical protein